ncbi:MAG TPA: GNAT family protein [Alphaproteobacteria bacterium]|nr:GNAT family protein [Alphaproteobacteria bacterium]
MYLLSSFLTIKPQGPRPSPDTMLAGPRVSLRMGEPGDWRAWRHLREASRAFLEPWEPAWPPHALGYMHFCGLLRRQARDWRQGKSYNFLIFKRADSRSGVLAGGVALHDVQRGIAQKATLGYWMGEAFAGQGLMTEAAGLACDFAFQTLRLHRLEASCMPTNEPSKRLLKRLGFAEEGYAKSYLRINGVWQDHLLWGIGAANPQTLGANDRRD